MAGAAERGAQDPLLAEGSDMRKVERGEDFGASFAGAKARRPGPIPQQREDNTWGTLVRYEEHPGLP